MGMCGGFAVACGGGRRGAAWHAGRLTTYALLGAAAGALGGILPGPSWVAAVVSTALLIWFAAALAGLVPEPTVKIPGLSRLAGTVARERGAAPGYLLGLSTGLLPCGLVYAALAVPVASGSAAVGALSMVAFGLGTAPALVAMTAGARRWVTRDLRARRALAFGVLVFGLASVAMRQGGPMTAHVHGAADEAAPTSGLPEAHSAPAHAGASSHAPADAGV
jgi:sulfite exporter TauE/SafE